MFTGIIEDIGQIVRVKRTGIEVSTSLARHDGLKIGDSLSINGICLTVIRINHKTHPSPHPSPTRGEDIITADVSPETLKLSNLCGLKPNQKVNLERALKNDARLGGHMVTGHVEKTGKIISIKNDKNSKVYEFSYPSELGKYIVKKGSIAIDGISLTVANVKNSNTFTVAVIPHTLRNTTLITGKPGTVVNLETDIMAKYAESLSKNGTDKHKLSGNISNDLLKRTGYIK